MGPTVERVSVNHEGFIAHRHIITSYTGNGELTLCGCWINYQSSKGEATDVKPCLVCQARDDMAVPTL